MPDFALPYSNKDWNDALAELKQQLPEVSEGQWTDYSEADPGYTLLKACAVLFDWNTFFTDQTAAENFLSTCTERESAVRIATSLNYIPALAQPATVQLRITNPAFTQPVVIPAYSSWLINNIAFVCPTQINIPAGQTSTTVNLIQGKPYNLPVNAPGTPFFKVSIPRNAANIAVTVNGVLWNMIDAFSTAPPTKTSYKRYEDAVSGQVIEFGAGVSTIMPKAGDQIQITATLTAGKKGNINVSGLPATLLSVVRDAGGANVTTSFSGVTLTAAEGGDDVESIESIKLHAPALYATQERSITKQDIEAYVLKFPGVKDCRVQGVKEGAPKGYYIVTVYGEDPNQVTSDFLAAVKAYLEALGLLCITPQMKAPVVVKVNCAITAGVGNNALFTSAGTTINLINAALATFFSGLRISDSIYLSELLDAIKVTDVKHANASFTVSTTITLAGTGFLVIPLITNADLTNAVLTDANGVAVLSGDLTKYNVAGKFVYSNTSLDSASYTLAYKPAVSTDGTNVLVPHGAVAINGANTVDVVLVDG